jgi:hypothetical protein
MGYVKTHTKDGRLLPHPQFYSSDGKRLASVTTIAKSVSGSNEGLLFWANAAGLDGLTLDDARRLPADIGTYAHDAIEAIIKKLPFDLVALRLEEDQHALVLGAIAEWKRWSEQCQLEILASEEALVTEEYGGVLDCVARVNGKVSILDWKTGGGIYPDNLIQVCAYGQLWEEIKYQAIEEYHLIRLGKTDASFHHHSWRAESPTVEAAYRMWRLAREVYPVANNLKKLVGG